MSCLKYPFPSQWTSEGTRRPPAPRCPRVAKSVKALTAGARGGRDGPTESRHNPYFTLALAGWQSAKRVRARQPDDPYRERASVYPTNLEKQNGEFE